MRGKSHSVCCHTKPDLIPDMQSETVASIIMDIDERSFNIMKGSPCLREYEKYILS